MVYTLENFYGELPNLHQKYLKNLNLSSNNLILNTTLNSSQTKTILVFASLGCIDSVVNMMVLYHLRDHFGIGITIILKGYSKYKDIQNGLTPTLYGLDDNEETIWSWQRAPQIIKDLESNAPQHKIIVEKMKYRNGGYLQETLDEVFMLISRN